MYLCRLLDFLATLYKVKVFVSNSHILKKVDGQSFIEIPEVGLFCFLTALLHLCICNADIFIRQTLFVDVFVFTEN